MKPIIFLFGLLLLLFVGCHGPKEEKDLTKPSVVVTLSPYNFFVKEIAGDTLQVFCLIANGKNPHTFEPTFKDTQKIFTSSIWFYLNEPFEAKILSSLPKKVDAIDLCENIPLISSTCQDHCHEKLMDRHLWLSPRSVKIQCQTIAYALIAKFPQHTDLYRKNLEVLLKRLSLLDEEITMLFSESPHKVIFVTHPAFAYLCRDYGVKQMFLVQEDKELNWKKLEKILTLVRKEKITTLFHQKQYNYQMAEQVASHLGLSLIMIDPFAENYFENMHKIATLFAKSPVGYDKSSNTD